MNEFTYPLDWRRLRTTTIDFIFCVGLAAISAGGMMLVGKLPAKYTVTTVVDTPTTKTGKPTITTTYEYAGEIDANGNYKPVQ